MLSLVCFSLFSGWWGRVGVKNCSVRVQTRRELQGPCIGLLSVFLECHNYEVLNGAERTVTNDGTPLFCDNTLGSAWLRFQGDAGRRIPTWPTRYGMV